MKLRSGMCPGTEELISRQQGKQDEVYEVSRLCNRLKSVTGNTELHYTKVGLVKLFSQLRLFVYVLI